MKKKLSGGALMGLSLAALGVVYGDIGTSPLYALKAAFYNSIPVNTDSVMAALSAFFWALLLVVSLKYVWIILNNDNEGEGGVLALMALVKNQVADGLGLRKDSSKLFFIVLLGMLAAGMFYADAVITPAISILSAVEGVGVAAPDLQKWVIPITVVILIILFSIQKAGTQTIGGLVFGPVMIIWFVVLAVLGIHSIAQTPEVLKAVNPKYALDFLYERPGFTFLLLSAVFLSVTGGEALYADMGHFGAKPVRLAWYVLVWPSLVLNYFGQGALLLRDSSSISNPFYLLCPDKWQWALVILATAATVIASQATITGAYSLTIQASRLNLLPRLYYKQTSSSERGQIYVPSVNLIMMLGVIGICLLFKSSEALASAYGLAVSVTMLITTMLLMVSQVVRKNYLMIVLLGFFIVLEIIFVLSNASKVAHGGWLPLVIAAVIFIVFYVWQKGQFYIGRDRVENSVKVASLKDVVPEHMAQVEGCAVYMASHLDVLPSAFMHNLKHYKVIHQLNIFMSIKTVNIPFTNPARRAKVTRLAPNFFIVQVYFGFYERPLVIPVLEYLKQEGYFDFDLANTTFFSSHSTLVNGTGKLNNAQFSLFKTLYKQGSSLHTYLGLPPNQMVELGTVQQL